MSMKFLENKIRDTYPNLSFWSLFFLLNGLLFVPFYWINKGGSTFWPSFTNEAGDGSLRWILIKLFVIRQNADFFRLSIDWVLLIAAWVWLRPLQKKGFRRVITAVFLFSIIYNTYDSVIFAIYNEYPNFYDDGLLLINGIEGLTRHIGIPAYVYILAGVGIVLFCWLCVWLIRQITAVHHTQKLNRYSHLLLAIIVGYVFIVMIEYTPFLDHPRIVTGSVVAKVNRNIQQSSSTYQNRQLIIQAKDALPTAYDYGSFNLVEKPDIYIIFIESYGDAIYQFDDIRPAYLDKIARLETQLSEANWQAASIRSEAPIRGGKSWLSYASFLFGLRIDDEAQYDVLLNEFQDGSYPHLGNYFKSQGYDYQRITPLLVTLERDAIAWEETRRFLGYDHWLFLNNMPDYAGPVYGWGPSPPDQYTLSFLRQDAETNRPDTPHLYFYITHNSHLPWSEPPAVVDDWQSLATASPHIAPNYDPYYETKEAYLQSIFYQLDMVTTVILNGPEDAIYVIVGDHQPPLRAFSNYEGSATPLHIISQNQELLDYFYTQQFADGLLLNDGQIFHEGFYSLFMEAALTTLGEHSKATLPPLLPEGIDLKLLVNE